MIVFNSQTVEDLDRDSSSDDEDTNRNLDDRDILDYQNNEFIGDILNENKPTDITRIYVQNLNGIKWDQDGGNWPSICEAMSAIHSDISCFSELNQDVRKFKVAQKMESIGQRFYNHHRFVASTSNRKASKTYKPGGTGILVVEDTTGLIRKTTRDRMGRWSSVHLRGANGIGVNIITAYQVCQSRITGTNTAANQQISQLIEEASTNEDLTRINPRQAFIRDLRQFISQLQHNGDRIILVGDFNETISETNSGIAELASECGLVDAFSVRLGTANVPNTYQRGHKRLDYALVSPDLMPSLQAAGYDPFSYRIHSDHRGFYLDFKTKNLFGNQPSPMAPFSQRDFISKSPGAVAAYILAKMKELKEHNFTERIRTLSELTERNDDLAESLDRDMQRAAAYAAKKAKRKYRTPWSPAFSKAWAKIHFYKLALSSLRNPTLEFNHSIAAWQLRHPYLPTELPMSIASAQQGHSEAIQELQAARQQASKLREEFLEAKASMYAQLEEHDKAAIVRRLKKAEEIHRTYLKLQTIRRRNGNSGIMELKIPIDESIDPKMCHPADTHWRTERAPAEIERLLLERNRQHFGQAEGTPFTLPNITTELHYDGSGQVADLILDGTFEPADVNDATKLFIKHLQRRSQETLTGTITAEEFIQKIKRWPESTSTSPSGIHLGHYHALQRHHGLPDDDPRKQQVIAGQQYLIDSHVALLNYAMKFGYTFNRWKAVVNVMLMKDPGNPKIHRLRVIHLYEADYNLLLAVKWRQAIHHAEDNGFINEGLYGSRPGRSAHEPVLIEVLQNEIYLTSMKSGINYDLDATSCYDRILAAIASITSRRMGMDKHVVLVNARTLQEAKFKLKTSLGISDAFYQHCTIYPIHGTGQGSGNSPQIWCFVCSVLFDALQATTSGATFYSYNGQQSITLHMIGFVDDCSQRVNDFQADPQPTAAILCARMQADAQVWNDLLFNSGGALELPKCSFHLTESECKPDGQPYLKAGTTAPNIYVTNGLVPSQVKQKSNFQSHKTLGCHVNPANRMHKQKTVLQAKSDDFADSVATNVFDPKEARTLYTSMYLPSVTYPFPVTCLTEANCEDIQKTFMQRIVPSLGFNSKMSLAIRYGPQDYGCAGLRELYVEQGVLTIMMVLKHLRSPEGQPGRMLRIALSWVQAYVGTSKPIWEFPAEPIPNHPAPYIEGIRKFLASIQAKIIIDPESGILPLLLREQDSFIMDTAIKQEYPAKILDRINSCRRYLQAVTVADIADPTGTRLLPGVTDGTKQSFRINMTGEKFNQSKPYPPAWLSWRTFLNTCLINPRGRLRLPLRDWIVPHHQCRHRAQFIHDPITNDVYRHHHKAEYKRLIPSPDSTSFTSDPDTPALPVERAYPIYAHESGTTYRIIRNYRILTTPPADMTGTFEMFLSTLPTWESDLLSSSELFDSPINIITELNSARFATGTDGSVIVESATFGVAAASSTSRRLFTIQGAAPGSRPQSFRAEGYGALAICRFLLRLSQYTGIALSQSFGHFLDNVSVIRRVSHALKRKYVTANSTLKPEWDLITLIKQSYDDLLVTPDLQWVKGHQDKDRDRDELSLAAQLNCEADDQAGEYQRVHGILSRPIGPFLPTTQAQLIINGESVSSHYKSRIREAATLPRYFDYITDRFEWNDETRHDVDWSAYKQIIRSLSSHHSTLVKHLHKIAPTGEIAHRNNHHYSSKCPSCDCENETNDHVLLCPAESRKQWRQTSRAKLLLYIDHTLSSDPVLCDILRDGLLRWESHLPSLDPSSYPTLYRPLIISQNRIGWDHLFRARWSRHWQHLHRSYAQRTSLSEKHSDGLSWVRKIGQKMVNSWFDLWKLRNQERHGADQREQKEKRIPFIRSQLEELYSFRNATMPTDRHMFHIDVDAHFARHPNLDHLEDWLLVWRPAIMSSVKQARDLHALLQDI